MNENIMTVFDSTGKDHTGIPNVHLNPYTNTAEVYLDDQFVFSCEGCQNKEEAIEMMRELFVSF